MSILGTDAYRFALASRLREARQKVSLVSAFITVPGIEWVLKHIPTSLTSVRVLSRWDCWDLVMGASDLEVYPAIMARGGAFYILPDLHAKIVLIDDMALLLGSANITNLGLRLVPGANREIGVSTTATAEDILVVETMFAEAIQVSPQLFQEFKKQVVELRRTVSTTPRLTWPSAFSEKLARSPERLWVTELLWTATPSQLTTVGLTPEQTEAFRHDLALLGFDPDSSITELQLREAFLQSRCYQWLIAKLDDRESRELYFGELSVLLHDALLDDPKPYRQEVKTLASNLIIWASSTDRSGVYLDQPKHSQRIRRQLT